jgi:hypothetical protein
MMAATPDFRKYILIPSSRVAGKAGWSAGRASMSFQCFDLTATPRPSQLVDATKLSAHRARHGEAPGNRADSVTRRPMLEQGHGSLKCVEARKIYFCRNGLSGDRLYGLEFVKIIDATPKDEENDPPRAVSNLSQGARLEGALITAHACDVGKNLKCSVE